MAQQSAAGRELDRAPGAHDPVVDLVRAGALLVVVLGHWLMQGLYVDAAGLHRTGLLGLAPWTHPLTWLLQVIPVIFVVGGYANARSWRRADRAGSYGTWVHVRVVRLTRPLVPLLLYWTVALLAAPHLGLGTDWVGIASRASLVPTWFLAAYLLVTPATPWAVRAWERWGWGSVLGGLSLVGLVDLVGLTTPATAVGGLNGLLVWATVHQLGVAWQAGAIGRAEAWTLVTCGAVGLALLVGPGPFGVSMVGVEGFGVDNTHPPRVTLVLLGCLQAGGTLLLRRPLSGLAGHAPVRRFALVLGMHLMTVYLWHMAALGMVVAGALWLAGAGGPHGLSPLPDTGEWWATRPLWMALWTLALLLVVRLIGKYERVARASEARSAWPALATAAVTSAGLVLLASGYALDDGTARWWLPLLVLVAPGWLGRSRLR